jgi:hypothetical protein
MTNAFEQYMDNRPYRHKLQEAYISRIVDTMDIKDLVQYAFDTLDEQLNELTDEQLYSDVKDVYPDLLENV